MRRQNKNKVFKKKEDKALRKQKQEERRELLKSNKEILYSMIEDVSKIIKTDRTLSGNYFIIPNEKYYEDEIRLIDIFDFLSRNHGAIFKKIFEYKKTKLRYGEKFKAEISVEEVAITSISMYILYGIITGRNYNINTKKIYALSKDINFKKLVLNIDIDNLVKKYSNS